MYLDLNIIFQNSNVSFEIEVSIFEYKKRKISDRDF
jgi:hypothetical protein